MTTYANYEYSLNGDCTAINPAVIIGLPDFAYIPNDMQNPDMQDYQQWLDAGNTPLPGMYRYVEGLNGEPKPDQIIRLPDNTLISTADTQDWAIYQTWCSYTQEPLPPLSS